MNELALFAGAGGGILGGKLLGWRTVCAVEINAFCARRLMQRQNEGHLPPFPIWDDVCTFDGSAWRGIVDVVSCGFPCQFFSTANHGRKTAENLWPQAFRVIKDIQPTVVFAENVAARAIQSAAKDLATLGYHTAAVKAGAEDMGADHIRTRYWLFAHTDDNGEFLCAINAEASRVQGMENSFWGCDPRSYGISNGLANRMDRNRAVGNGQSPAVVWLAWNVLGAASYNDLKNR